MIKLIVLMIAAYFMFIFGAEFSADVLQFGALALTGQLTIVNWNSELKRYDDESADYFYSENDAGFYPVHSPFIKSFAVNDIVRAMRGQSRRDNGIDTDAVYNSATLAANEAASIASADIEAIRREFDANEKLNRRGSVLRMRDTVRTKSRHSSARIGVSHSAAIEFYQQCIAEARPNNKKLQRKFSADNKALADFFASEKPAKPENVTLAQLDELTAELESAELSGNESRIIVALDKWRTSYNEFMKAK